MKPTQTIQKLEVQIAQIKAQLQKQRAMRPGSLSRQYNVCGKPRCRCKDPKRPRRHGPYYQLNYVYRAKKTSQFIRREILGQVRTELANYKQFRRLTGRWVRLALQVAQAKDKLTARNPPARRERFTLQYKTLHLKTRLRLAPASASGGMGIL
jgi:hypothetical protein